MLNEIFPKDIESTFPEIRALKGKYQMSLADLGNIVNNTYQTFNRKLIGKSEFGQFDMIKITKYFNSKGENVTIHKLFFDWLYSNE
jgi:hypothetical protein